LLNISLSLIQITILNQQSTLTKKYFLDRFSHSSLLQQLALTSQEAVASEAPDSVDQPESVELVEASEAVK
jgi:hypothetical protein